MMMPKLPWQSVGHDDYWGIGKRRDQIVNICLLNVLHHFNTVGHIARKHIGSFGNIVKRYRKFSVSDISIQAINSVGNHPPAGEKS